MIGPNIIFSSANIHIVSGSGRTDDNGNRTGLGNLIVGYGEDPKNYFRGFDGGPGGGFPLSPGDRGGSHNLVIGEAHRFTQAAFGGLVAGQLKTIDSIGASVIGGYANRPTAGTPASAAAGSTPPAATRPASAAAAETEPAA